MFCRRYRPEKLLPKSELLASLLLQNEHIVGVALTGSLARQERKIHDIDLVVFHDGALQDGSCQDPERKEPYYSDDLILPVLLKNGMLSRHLSQARADVPVNYIFIGERAIGDCGYLKSLEAKEKFPEFYLRVLCDIPLVLLYPYRRRGVFRERFKDEDIIALDRGLPWTGLCYPGLPIRHLCEDACCRPKKPWSECRKEIKRRKGHWWHPFMTLLRR